jgi:glycosyltransferase involved in cell wall biosynthesis
MTREVPARSPAGRTARRLRRLAAERQRSPSRIEGMAKITIGVPVFNGMPFLPDCLQCLRDQTFEDFEVLIFDNASDDATPQVAAQFVADDHRFHYFRQDFNRGPVANFRDVLTASTSRYFIWRAADDGSDPDYLEALYRLLEDNPTKDLAAACIVSRKHDGSGRTEHLFPAISSDDSGLDRLRLLFGAHASWIYGLFRREALIPLIEEVDQNYPDPWGWDYVALFPLLLDGRVIGTNATHFEQGLDVFKKPRQDSRIRSDLKIALRARFLHLALNHVRQRFHDPSKRLFFSLAAWLYANKRICTLRKAIRGRLQRSLARTERGH